MTTPRPEPRIAVATAKSIALPAVAKIVRRPVRAVLVRQERGHAGSAR